MFYFAQHNCIIIIIIIIRVKHLHVCGLGLGLSSTFAKLRSAVWVLGKRSEALFRVSDLRRLLNGDLSDTHIADKTPVEENDCT